jgi:hypothetical protein
MTWLWELGQDTPFRSNHVEPHTPLWRAKICGIEQVKATGVAYALEGVLDDLQDPARMASGASRGHEARNVFKQDEPRPQFGSQSDKFPEKLATPIPESLAEPRERKRLAGGPAREHRGSPLGSSTPRNDIGPCNVAHIAVQNASVI